MNVMNMISYICITILFPQPPPSTMHPPAACSPSCRPRFIYQQYENDCCDIKPNILSGMSLLWAHLQTHLPLTIQKWLRHHSHEEWYVKGDVWELCIESPCFVCPPFISPAIIIPSPTPQVMEEEARSPHQWSMTWKRTNAAPMKQCTTNDMMSCNSGWQGPWEPGHQGRSGLYLRRNGYILWHHLSYNVHIILCSCIICFMYYASSL